MRKGQQPPWIVSDDLWARIQPLLPAPVRRFPNAGRKRLEDRLVLQGILFMLHTGIQWEYLPRELGFGSGMTCWRRLEEWNRAGVWSRLHAMLLAELQAADKLDWSRAAIDSSHVRAARRGPKVGRARSTVPDQPGKHPVLTDGHGIPLATALTGGNRNDVTQLVAPAGQDSARPRPPRPTTPPPHRGVRRSRLRPDKYRRLVRARGVRPRIARRGIAHGSGLGIYR